MGETVGKADLAGLKKLKETVDKADLAGLKTMVVASKKDLATLKKSVTNADLPYLKELKKQKTVNEIRDLRIKMNSNTGLLSKHDQRLEILERRVEPVEGDQDEPDLATRLLQAQKDRDSKEIFQQAN